MRLGKACMQDMPIGYNSSWQETEAALARRYAAWLSPGGLLPSRESRTEQKRCEMELADVTLVLSAFAEGDHSRLSSEQGHRAGALRRRSGILDAGRAAPRSGHNLRFIYAGHVSIHKGTPLLLEAWEKAALLDYELELACEWHLAERRRKSLPTG